MQNKKSIFQSHKKTNLVKNNYWVFWWSAFCRLWGWQFRQDPDCKDCANFFLFSSPLLSLSKMRSILTTKISILSFKLFFFLMVKGHCGNMTGSNGYFGLFPRGFVGLENRGKGSMIQWKIRIMWASFFILKT